MSTTPWQRPSNVPFPSVWSKVEGRKPLGPNAVKPKFRIQDITPDLIEPAVHHMNTNFLLDEPLCKHLGIGQDQKAMDEINYLWRELISNFKIGLIAILENGDEIGVDLPKVAGVNMCFPLVAGEKDVELTGKIRSMANYMNVLSHRVNFYEKHNIDVYLYAYGLSVGREYRGQNLGEEIIKARYPLCRAVGIPLTVTVFSGPYSLALATRAGMELLDQMAPEDYVEDNGEKVFLGVDTEAIYLMSKLIDNN